MIGEAKVSPRAAGIKVCSSGIIGMDENVEGRLGMLVLPANLLRPGKRADQPVERGPRACRPVTLRSSPIRSRADAPGRDGRNHDVQELGRLFAGRRYMTDELQALCSFGRRESDLHRRCAVNRQKPPQRDRDATSLDQFGITSRLS